MSKPFECAAFAIVLFAGVLCTSNSMAEIKIERVKYGGSVCYREDWYLFDNVRAQSSDESIDANVLPQVESVLK